MRLCDTQDSDPQRTERRMNMHKHARFSGVLGVGIAQQTELVSVLQLCADDDVALRG